MPDNTGRGPAGSRDATPEVETAEELTLLRAENAALRGRLEVRRTARRRLSHGLVVLSAVMVVVSTVAAWTYRTVFDTDQFMSTIDHTLDDPAFREALSNRVATEVLAALDLERRVTTRLDQLDEFLAEALVDAIDPAPEVRGLLTRFDRPTMAVLAPPIASALEDRVVQITDRLIASEEFTSGFPAMVRHAHAAAVALVRGDMAALPNVYTENGQVRLNLVPIIADVLRQVIAEFGEFLPDVDLPTVISHRVDEGLQQLANALGTRLPPDFGQVTLLSESSLGEVQQALDRLDRLMWLLVLVTSVMIAGTITVSPNRRQSVARLGVAVVVGFMLGAVVIHRLQTAMLESIASPDGRQVAGTLLTATLSDLRSVTLVVGAVALLGAIAAHLAGRPTWLGRVSARGTQFAASWRANSVGRGRTAGGVDDGA